MSELKKGFYLVTANGINTMLRWDGEDWVDMRGIRPCFKEVVQTRYCGENNPVFEQDEPIAFVTGVFGGRFIVEPTNPAMVLPVNIALYTHPKQRTWVGLTDDDLEKLKLLTFEKEINVDGEEQEAVNLDQLIHATAQLCKEKNHG